MLVHRQIGRLPGQLRAFRRLEKGWYKWIDSLTKEQKSSMDVAFRLQVSGGASRVGHFLMTMSVANPKVQLLAVACPVESSLDDIFTTGVPDVPYNIAIQSSRSRLASHRQDAPEHLGIFFVTSDELLYKLAIAGGQWQVFALSYDMVAGDTLLNMRVTGDTSQVDLEGQLGGHVRNEDAFYAWQRLPVGRPTDAPLEDDLDEDGHGEASNNDDGPCDDDADAAGVAEAVVAADAVGEALESMLAEMFTDDENTEGSGVSDVADDEVEAPVPQPEEPDEGDDEAEGVGGDDGATPPPEAAEARELGGEVSALLADAEVAVGDDAPIYGPESPEFTMSQLGYVRGLRAPHTGDIIGLVGYKSDRRSIFANCHMHPACSISAGIMRCDIQPAWMANWLVSGTPIARDAPKEQRAALGLEHRRKWARPDAG